MGNSQSRADDSRVRVVASDAVWLEGEALRQLEEVSKLPGMVRAVGLPDLHPGKGSPVGAAFLSDGVVYPSLVGGDVGCGVALWRTDLALRKADPQRIAARLDGVDSPWDGDTGAWLAGFGLEPTGHEAALGTTGAGNHFVEVQAVERILDRPAAEALGLERDRAALLVHTGSRGVGEALWRAHAANLGAAGVTIGSPEADSYLAAHDRAARWAEANRALVAHRVLDALGRDGEKVSDTAHNTVTRTEAGLWLHRKGAAPADRGVVAIPGSRGAVTYLVAPVLGEDGALWSLAHGAGRKLARHEARSKLKERIRRDDLRRNPWGGRVVIENDLIAYEEAPEAYKDIDDVVDALVAAGLVRLIAVLRPIVTFKSSEAGRTGHRGRSNWKAERHAARAAKERSNR